MGYLCNFDMILKSLFWDYLYITNVRERFVRVFVNKYLIFLSFQLHPYLAIQSLHIVCNSDILPHNFIEVMDKFLTSCFHLKKIQYFKNKQNSHNIGSFGGLFLLD